MLPLQGAFAQDDNVKLSINNKSISVKQGESVSIDLLLTVNSGWHINSNKPNDEFLIPSEITAKANGIKLVSVKYPAPTK